MAQTLERLLSADRIRAFLDAARKTLAFEVSGSQNPGDLPLKLPEEIPAFLRCGDSDPAEAKRLALTLETLIAYEHENSDLTRELSNQYEELTLLYRLSSAFSRTLHIDRIQKSTVDEISETLGVGKVGILMLDEAGEGLVLTAGLGANPANLGKVRFAKGKGLAWRVIETGQSLIANDLASYPEYDQGTMPDSAILLVPVATESGIAGVLAVSNKDDGSGFTSKDEKLLATIAQQMGAVWENAKLFRETRELFLNTVEALSAAIDAKDPYTHGHSRRVTIFSVEIAVDMGLPETEVERIRIAALLHDIGKLGISENILRKPDRLTNEEFGEIKRHPVIGAEIMGHVKKLSQFIPGMIDHHEKFNGTGYPGGLKGDQISLAGRIIAVADTFDAITSNRPYHPDKKGKPDQVALDEIRKCGGTHFDPTVVEAFFKAYSRGVIHQDDGIQAPG